MLMVAENFYVAVMYISINFSDFADIPSLVYFELYRKQNVYSKQRYFREFFENMFQTNVKYNKCLV